MIIKINNNKNVLVVLYVRLTQQYFFYKYCKRLKRKMKTPQLTFIKIKCTNKNTTSNLYLYNMHK